MRLLRVRCDDAGRRAPIRLARQNRPLTACGAVFAVLVLHELQIAYRQQVRPHKSRPEAC